MASRRRLVDYKESNSNEEDYLINGNIQKYT